MSSLIKQVPRGVWILALAHCVADLAPGALYVALPFLKAKFALSYAQVSAIVLMQNVAASVSQPLFGYISDQRHRPWLMTAGCLLTGVFMVASLFAPHYYLVLLCTALCGLGNAAFHPEAAKTVNQISGTAKGKSISVFSVGGYVGLAAGSLLLGTLLVGGESLRLVWYALPSIIISGILLVMTKYLPHTEIKAKTTLGSLKAYVNWPLMALLGMILTRATVSSSIGTFVPLYYISHLGGNELYVSSLLTTYLSAGIVGTLVGGMLSDRYGSKQVMLYSILPIALLLYVFLSASGAGVFVILAVASVLLSATATSSLVFTQKMMPRNIGMASGLTLGFSVGVGTMGVWVLGKVADVWDITAVFDVLVVLPVLGFLLTLFIREPESRKMECNG